MLINVPYIKQPLKSTKCGAACAAMLIKYYEKKDVDIDVIWNHIGSISPELGRPYCKTHKIGDYLTKNHFNACTVRYSSLKKLLEFCISNEIAPIINHKSFENNFGGHFSVVKNISGDIVVINDPESKKRNTVSLNNLIAAAEKNSVRDEVGGNIAVIPIMDKFPNKVTPCPRCSFEINTSLSDMVNVSEMIIIHNICHNCDVPIPC